MSIFNELKRRNVFRVGIAYVVLGWLLLQVTDVVVPILDLPDWVDKLVLFLLVIGFPLVLFFAWAFELTPDGIKREKDVDRSQSITSKTGRKLNYAITALLAIAVVYLVIDKFRPGDVETAEVVATEAVTEPEEQVKSIAVLPFVNMSDDAANEYFSDGISEEILNALAKVKDLKVAGRTSSFAFKGENQDLRRIGEALGVKHILEGSVRKAGNTVRITAQLIQVDDGFHLWSETYDRELTNVFAIQDEIAMAILGELKAELLDTDVSVLASATTDTRAYEQFLLAKQRIYDRNKASLEAAGRLLDSVIEIDPDYAPAHAQRAVVYLLLVDYQYGDLQVEQALQLAKPFIDKSLALDPGLAEGWAVLGLYHGNLPGGHFDAIEALEKAISINPNMINASNWLQIAYKDAGMHGKVLPILEGMLERDPLYRPAIANAITEFNRLGMQERSLTLIEKVRPFIPDDAHLVNSRASTLLTLGRYAEALPLSEEAVRRQPTDGIFRLWLGLALWNTHQYEKLTDSEFPPFQRIFALQLLDRTEEATILAYEEAAKGFPADLLWLLNRTNRSDEAARYIDERWPELDDFEAAYPHGGNGYPGMVQVALAYSKTGNVEKFHDAMRRVRSAHDQLIAGGVQSAIFHWIEAIYYALARDHDKALEHLGIAADKGWPGWSLRLSRTVPALEPLEGDPRYEAVQARMIENLNKQRALLGLEPATI
jgi:TolB-like protein